MAVAIVLPLRAKPVFLSLSPCRAHLFYKGCLSVLKKIVIVLERLSFRAQRGICFLPAALLMGTHVHRPQTRRLLACRARHGSPRSPVGARLRIACGEERGRVEELPRPVARP